jgi:hypothetical protein
LFRFFIHTIFFNSIKRASFLYGNINIHVFHMAHRVAVVY